MYIYGSFGQCLLTSQAADILIGISSDMTSSSLGIIIAAQCFSLLFLKEQKCRKKKLNKSCIL